MPDFRILLLMTLRYQLTTALASSGQFKMLKEDVSNPETMAVS